MAAIREEHLLIASRKRVDGDGRDGLLSTGTGHKNIVTIDTTVTE